METSKTFPVTHTDAEWRALLTPEQYRDHARARHRAPGQLRAAFGEAAGHVQSAPAAASPCSKARRKFDSGTGWPSFNARCRRARRDRRPNSWGMTRTEVHCARCGSHLGHVFPDGPPPTGLRYCINGVATNFNPAQ